MTIAQNIRMFRKIRGLSQGQLGEMIGMTGGAICSYENGTTIPKHRVVEKIARALDVPTEKIAEETAAVPVDGARQETRTGDALLYGGVLTLLKELYGMVEGRMVMGENGNCQKYYIVHHSNGSFVLYEKDIAAIVRSAEASLRSMAGYMKKTRDRNTRRNRNMVGAGSGI